MNTAIDFTRISNDTNGNARYICHFTNLLTDQESAGDWSNDTDHFGIHSKYAFAAARANKIGGRKFRGKKYGGGIVFTTVNIFETERQIHKLMDSVK